MKFYNRVILTFSSIILLLIGGVFFSVFFFYSEDYRIYLDKTKSVEYDNFFSIFNLKNEGSYKLINDYSCWTGMAEFISNVDSSWAATNIVDNSQAFDFNMMLVFGSNGNLVFRQQNRKELTGIDLPPNLIRLIFSHRKVRHFYYRKNNTLIEFFGATVHNSDDDKRTGRIYGYLLCGKIWDEKYLKAIESLTKTKIIISEKVCPQQDIIPAQGLVVNHINLLDHNQSYIGELHIESHSQILEDFYISNKIRIISIIVFGIILLFILFILLYQIKKHILKPINQIIKAAEEEKYDHLVNNLTGEPEFLPVAERIILSFQQKSHLQRLNQELINLKENLEQTVNQRTTELQQSNTELKKTLSELQQSYDLIVAQEKLVSLGTMVAGITHEINNPVQAIKFSVEALKLNITDIKEFADEIFQMTENSQSSEMKHLKQVVDFLDLNSIMLELDEFVGDNLKAVNRIQNIVNGTKRMVYTENSFVDCNINEIISDAVTLLSGQIKNLITLRLNLQSDLPQYTGLPQELGQIFINLITNAKDAMLENGLAKEQNILEISTSYDHERKNLKIIFKDNGCGMPKATIDKIFDPFFTTKPSGKGTGLGLSIVFKILKAHNGTIDVESEPGQGTAFTIYLPLYLINKLFRV